MQNSWLDIIADGKVLRNLRYTRCQGDRTQIFREVLHGFLCGDWCHIGELPNSKQQLLFKGGVQDDSYRICKKRCVLFRPPIWDSVGPTSLCRNQLAQHFANTMLGDLQELRRVILQGKRGERISKPLGSSGSKSTLFMAFARSVKARLFRSSMLI